MIFPNFLQEALKNIRGTAGEAGKQLTSNFADVSKAINPQALHESSLSYSDTKQGFLASFGIIFTKNIMYPERFGSARVANRTEAINFLTKKDKISTVEI